ncbi:GDP-mannose 4,6-dehydratase [Flavobacteriaceae bacterium]|nr:GDP-mannose 4,6-dehydratase [Flavobacteriaceae bacterium]
MYKKKAFITGVAGQDGSYLSEFLLNKGYEVHGMLRRSSLEVKGRISHLYEGEGKDTNFYPHYGDVTDPININNLILKIQPDEVYNLAAQSHVRISFDIPNYTANTDALGTLNILESIRQNKLEDKCKFYQASTSELFGKAEEVPQSETTSFYPRSPYATAKLYAYWATVNYREAYGIFGVNGILFNHESPRRGNSFVTKKIVESIGQIILGKSNHISIGNLNAKRDWGYAPEYVEAMWLMLQNENPIDLVIATGETHTVREFIELAFQTVDYYIEWHGEGIDEVGKCKKTGKTLVKIDPYYFRPTEVDLLLGDPSLAKKKIGWEAKTKFKELVNIMMKHELNKSNAKQ